MQPEPATTDNKEILQYCEFETKYKVNGDLVYQFKHLIEKSLGIKDFVYVQSDDVYYVKGEEFLRHRFSESPGGRAELTYKRKMEGSKNNIIRTEVNLRVDPNEPPTVEKFANVLGFIRNFQISKYCHIYHTDKATVVFYSVRDWETNKLDHFIEIEVNEDLQFTEAEGWEIIRDWEAKLEPLGITARNRLRKSLFEMYRKLPPKGVSDAV